MADYNLSFHDLQLVDGFKDAEASQNKKVFEAILFTNGMDVGVGYELVHCTHRTLNKIEYTGIRVEGTERIDAAWVATGCASMEAQIEAGTDDIGLRKDLRRMKYQGIQDKVISRS